MEQPLMQWTKSSTSPGIRTNEKLKEVNRGRIRLEPNGSLMLSDGKYDNVVQTVVDENEEWAKIEDIMASLDAGMNDRDEGLNGFTWAYHCRKLVNNATLSTQSNTAVPDVHSVRHWLDSLGLSHLEDVLVTNGFDDIEFLGPTILSDSDLIEVGVTSAAIRHKLLSATAKLPPFTCSAPKQFSSLVSWLTALRLSEYVETFQLHGFTTIDRLHNLWDVELTSVLHVGRLGHRNRITAAISALPAPTVPQKGSECQLESVAEPGSSCPAKQSLNDVSLFKDYTSLLRTRSKTSQSLSHADRRLPLPDQHNNQKQDLLRIRPPQADGSEIKQWTHQPEVLLNGSCLYQVMYVGQGVVECFNNTSATHEAIMAIRQHCARTLRGTTRINMCISHTGVELVKLTSKELLGSYSIGNIFCVSQDVEHLDYFAFVTFQPSANVHYCHVFCAENVQLAVEVVLTLGQAFEVAYQLAVRKNGSVLENGGDTAKNHVAPDAITRLNANELAAKHRSPVVADNSSLLLKL